MGIVHYGEAQVQTSYHTPSHLETISYLAFLTPLTQNPAPHTADATKLADIALFESGKDIMELLRQKHPALGTTLESMLQV